MVALCFQLLRLLLELRVRLLQFDLLLLKPGLRLFERPTLFFQFLIGDAQFFALRLQLLGLALRFLKQVLELIPILGRPDRKADGSGRSL